MAREAPFGAFGLSVASALPQTVRAGLAEMVGCPADGEHGQNPFVDKLCRRCALQHFSACTIGKSEC